MDFRILRRMGRVLAAAGEGHFGGRRRGVAFREVRGGGTGRVSPAVEKG